VALAAFIFHLVTAPVAHGMVNTKIGEDTDPTRTLTMDNTQKDWEEVIRPILAQREKQIEEQRKAEEARKKAEAQAKAVVASKKAPAPQPVKVQVSGNKADWMRAAGIPEAHWAYVDAIVTRESGWNPNAVNRSSGACGLGQQLPCGKWAGAWNDPVAALRAMTGYVNARYGGWAGAVAFWNRNHWY
jgi:hypothetical protein